MPMLVSPAFDASSIENVKPSAPVPPFRAAVNVADSPSLATGAVKTAEPTLFSVAGVRTTPFEVKVAEPLVFQPPAVGLGRIVPFVATPVPVTVIVCEPAPSSELITYCELACPAAVGTNDTGICSTSSGASTWPSASGALTSNGAAGGAAFVMVTFRVPTFATVRIWVDEESTPTEPKSIDVG